LPRRRQGKSRPSTASTSIYHCEEVAGQTRHWLTIDSYGLFKAADKKMLKNEELAAELGRPEKVVEM
jgi:hypothetical protein